MPVANINRVNLNYKVAGQGEAVVFVHGYTGSSQDWINLDCPQILPPNNGICREQGRHYLGL